MSRRKVDIVDMAIELVELEPADLRTAAVRVCEKATDPDDARALLEALGLLDLMRAAARELAVAPQ